jgi:hypothetical protein
VLVFMSGTAYNISMGYSFSTYGACCVHCVLYTLLLPRYCN